MDLPIWPPLVALALAYLLHLYGKYEARKFDERFPPRKDERRRS